MRRKHYTQAFILLAFLSTTIKAEEQNVTSDDDNETDAFLRDIRFDMFDLHLCQALYTASPMSNVAVSPVSVKLILAMLYEAARGETAKELQQTLDLPQSKKESRVRFGAIQRSLNMPSANVELKSASRIFIPPNSTYSEGYSRVLTKYFSANMQVVDFSKPREAAKIVNSWVCEATNGKIQQMLDPNDPQIVKLNMILSNALFFKGLWEYPFDKRDTKQGIFYLSNGNTVQLQIMENQAVYKLAENKNIGYRLLRLPYMGNKYSLYIILPMERNGLGNVLKQISPDDIRETMSKMLSTQVKLELPKFSFQFAVDLEPILKQLGIKKMFLSNEASFPSISNTSRVYVSRILHKAGLDVNEVGSTVHAATVANMGIRFGTPYETFKVDHPFVFFIKDDTASTIVFAAKVENPLTKPGNLSASHTSAPEHTSVNKHTKNRVHSTASENRPESSRSTPVPTTSFAHKIFKRPRSQRQFQFQNFNGYKGNTRDDFRPDIYSSQKQNYGYNSQIQENNRPFGPTNYGYNKFGPPNYGTNNFHGKPNNGHNNFGPSWNNHKNNYGQYNVGYEGHGKYPSTNWVSPNSGPVIPPAKGRTPIKTPTRPTVIQPTPWYPTGQIKNITNNQQSARPAPITSRPITDFDYEESIKDIFGSPPPSSGNNAPMAQMMRPATSSPRVTTEPNNQQQVDNIFSYLVSGSNRAPAG